MLKVTMYMLKIFLKTIAIRSTCLHLISAAPFYRVKNCHPFLLMHIDRIDGNSIEIAGPL
jgi:hypothetical protein